MEKLHYFLHFLLSSLGPFTSDCAERQPRDQSKYEELLRNHSDVYPTGECINAHVDKHGCTLGFTLLFFID
jgi:hypothetical protein